MRMNVAIFGMGYVGTTCAAFFGRHGHRVTGVERDRDKARLLAEGDLPFEEPGVREALAAAAASGCFRMTTAVSDAVKDADISLVCVGTPTGDSGIVETRQIEQVASQIGAALARRRRFHVIVIRSTSPPGTVARATSLVATASGLRPDRDFAVTCNPEFLREGSALADMAQPPFTVVGASCPAAAAALRRLYAQVAAPFLVVAPAEAEMLKYVSNAFHALKVAFANEVGEVARRFGVDGGEVMALFSRDTKLNISSSYLRPGFAFGGSCLPKDVRALVGAASREGLDMPLLNSILPSNDAVIERAVTRAVALADGGRVAVLGLAFKPGSDDMRESPFLRLAAALHGCGVPLALCEPHFDPARLFGANRDYMERILPDLASLLAPDAAQAVDGAAVVVLTRREPAFAAALARRDAAVQVLDLTPSAGRRTRRGETGDDGFALTDRAAA